MRAEVFFKRPVVLRAAGFTAYRIDFKPRALNSQLVQKGVSGKDNLRVRLGLFAPKHLYSELVELAQAPLLRTLVTVARRNVIGLQRQSRILQAVFDKRACNAGSALGL